MALNPLYPQEVDLSKIKYAEIRTNPTTQARSVGIFYGSSRLTVEFPLMNIAYNGVSKVEQKDAKGNVIPGSAPRYEMSLSFKGMEENSKIKALHTFLENLETKLKKDGFDNRITWFKEDFDDEPKFVAKNFHPMIQVSKDKETRKPDGKWPSTFKVKLPFEDKTGKFNFEAHDMEKNEVDFADIWDKLKGGRAKPILQLSSIWFAAGKFGLTWRLVMSKFQVSSRGTYTYRDEEDDKGVDAVETEEEDDVDIPPQILQKKAVPPPAPVNTVVEDSDEEDEVVEAEEEDADDVDSEVEVEERTPSPPPPPPKKTTVKKTTTKAK